jgi:hypothetical protein
MYGKLGWTEKGSDQDINHPDTRLESLAKIVEKYHNNQYSRPRFKPIIPRI